MKPLRLITLLFVVAASCVFAEAPAGWSTNFTSALEEGKRRQQPVLVYFTASWCGPCKLMARTTFTNASVVKTLGGLNHVALDIDEHPELAEKYSISAIPTFQMLTPAGDAVVRITGFQEPAEFLLWLTNSVGEVKEAVVREKRLAEKIAGTDELLRKADAESLRKAAAELFNLSAEHGNAIQQIANARLVTLAARDPALLLDGLNHPQLAARIQAANLLRARLRETFDVDPWAEAATREKAIAQWREKLIK